jgi:hypothetical protein
MTQELPILYGTYVTQVSEASPGIYELISNEYARLCPNNNDCGAIVCASYFNSENSMAFINPYIPQTYHQYGVYTPSSFWEDRTFQIQGVVNTDPYFSSFTLIPGMSGNCIGFGNDTSSCYSFIMDNIDQQGCVAFLLSNGSPTVASC